MKRFKNILCVTNANEDCTVAIDQAARLVEHNQGALTVAILGKESAGLQHRGSCSEKIESTIEAYRKCIAIQIKFLEGKPYLGIIREVLRDNYNLVIKVQSTANWKNRLLNKIDKQLLDKCPCPVWLANPHSSKANQKIVVAVDVSEVDDPAEGDVKAELNWRILDIASTMAIFNSSELHVAQAWHLFGESAMRGSFNRTPEEKISVFLQEKEELYSRNLDTLISSYFKRPDLKEPDRDLLVPRVHLVKGWVHEKIPALAKQIEADLVIMGAIARSGIANYTMGGPAKSVFERLNCSFLLVKQPGFIPSSRTY